MNHNATNNTLVSSLFANIGVEGIELIWVHLHLTFRVSVLLGCVYRRPTSDIINLQIWLNNIESNIFIDNKSIFIVGNFNFPEINRFVPTPINYNNSSILFLEMFTAFGMMQYNKLPTHDDNLLDLCFKNNPACYN